jgi:hypothetical protein
MITFLKFFLLCKFFISKFSSFLKLKLTQIIFKRKHRHLTLKRAVKNLKNTYEDEKIICIENKHMKLIGQIRDKNTLTFTLMHNLSEIDFYDLNLTDTFLKHVKNPQNPLKGGLMLSDKFTFIKRLLSNRIPLFNDNTQGFRNEQSRTQWFVSVFKPNTAIGKSTVERRTYLTVLAFLESNTPIHLSVADLFKVTNETMNLLVEGDFKNEIAIKDSSKYDLNHIEVMSI